MALLIWILGFIGAAFVLAWVMQALGLSESQKSYDLRQVEKEQERLGFEEWNRRTQEQLDRQKK